MQNPIEVVAAGHICIDIIPAFPASSQHHDDRPLAGRLVHVGPALLSLGGSVANTGLALHRLGVPTGLMGKVGNDLFGQLVVDILHTHDPRLAADMLVVEGEATSYSVVISPPGVDRTFYHFPGANDTFVGEEVQPERVRPARLFHFGYPPLMRGIYQDGGATFSDLLSALKAEGITTSLDMALPDPDAEAGRVDWRSWLQQVLPQVDVFMPSIEEIAFMLKVPPAAGQIDGQMLSTIGQQCLQWGAAIVAIKLGENGLYLRTNDDLARLERLGHARPEQYEHWRQRELLTTCFQVEAVGTTGAGDCTIAGFLLGLLSGQRPEEAITSAVAVGACSVEQADATSGISPWPQVQQRLQASWRRCSARLPLHTWYYDVHQEIWYGPSDVKPLYEKEDE